LAQQLESLFPLVCKLVPKSNKLLETHLDALKEIPKTRASIYAYVAKVAIDHIQIQESISKLNWDINEIMSQHNSYVEVLLRQVQQIIIDVESLNENLPIEKQTLNYLLEQCLKLTMRTLVDGYAQVKKCSNEGRALMQLDFQQLIVKLEKLCEIRPIPDKDYVELYIKAYYLPESSIEKWIKDHTVSKQTLIIFYYRFLF
jgi:syndetin